MFLSPKWEIEGLLPAQLPLGEWCAEVSAIVQHGNTITDSDVYAALWASRIFELCVRGAMRGAKCVSVLYSEDPLRFASQRLPQETERLLSVQHFVVAYEKAPERTAVGDYRLYPVVRFPEPLPIWI